MLCSLVKASYLHLIEVVAATTRLRVEATSQRTSANVKFNLLSLYRPHPLFLLKRVGKHCSAKTTLTPSKKPKT